MDHHNAQHSVSVAGVIVDDQGRALLTQRRDNGRWEAPGGVLERDEDVITGLLREIHEETGLTVEPVMLTGVYKNMTRGIVALVFRCKVIGGHLTETGETRAFRWVTVDEVSSLASEAFAIRVLDAVRSDQVPAVRHHDGTRLLGVPQSMSHPMRRLAVLSHDISDRRSQR
ncbi:NUDIX hydrolase [Streptosporangium violaceochromogenes]|nr:NUDIX hydrolase [Streptosporangium violaceochromogenes]